MVEAVVDANVLLRYLTGVPPALAARAEKLLVTAEQRKIRLIVTSLTLAEVVFVLEHTYRWPRQTLAQGLSRLLISETFSFPEAALLDRAFSWYREMPRVHFADAYIAAVATERGAVVLSFDRSLKRLRDPAVVDTLEALPHS